MEIFIIVLLCFAAAGAGYLVFVNCRVRVNKIRVGSEKIPSAFENYRIVFLSDMHDSRFCGFFGNRLLKKVKDCAPDVIFLGGDMHEIPEKDEAYFGFLKNLASVAPLYFIEGNHERKLRKRPDFKSYFEKFEKLVFNLNGQTEIFKNGEKIKLYGCGYSEYEKNLFSFDERCFSVFLYHSPFVFDDFSSPPDLMISGHVHGGIIEIPFVGALFSPGNGRPIFERFSREFFFPKYYKNTYFRGESVLAVGKGIGNFKRCPLRFMSPEIVEITLNCGKV